MRILVYVEGPGDRASLEKLFRPLVEEGRRSKVSLTLHPAGGKDWILHQLGRTAANHLKSNPDDYIFALPDLYPMAKYARTPAAHGSFAEMKTLLLGRFREAADRYDLPDAVRSHYRVHCLKHDLEVLLLGAPDVLRRRLGTDDGIEKNWRKPPEDQNDHQPPKRVVEQLFHKYRKKTPYTETIDAPWILERASAEELCRACPQNFRPLHNELSRLVRGEPPE
ncbi:DUF4276 family protein [Pyxidicoccus trucidator]|uniref:DUF4276 family protein n=1 Tax=Pyxidicoccus trucidator TaxID=2709662 RepID=UPI0013DD5284|nr:DUF4276 family protein [Pyxidicoccus trucidator]